ncbi:MAG: SurA N-terminal domain-containing protein [Bacteroidota bacterium]|nr:SurA N-terminal domain-containing protein [Bacteroidota bacterium]
MAIIGRIRKHSGLVITIVGIAIASFVIGDLSRKRAPSTTDIGTVNGENITYSEFNSKVDEAINLQKENTQNEKITEDETYNIRQSVWGTMVKDIIMGKELDRLGLVVSPEELFDQVQGKNPHRFILQYFVDPKTKIYDPTLVLNYLKNLDKMEPKAKEQWLRFEKAIKEDRLQTKFNNLVAKAFYMPSAFLKKEYIRQTEAMHIRSIAAGPEMVADNLVHITDADYQKFYDENKAYFQTEEETRDLDFVVFEVVPSESDRKKIKDDIDQIYKDFSVAADLPNFINANSDTKFDSTFHKKGTLPSILDSNGTTSPVNTLFAPFEFNKNWYMAKSLAVEDRPDTMKGSQILITYTGTAIAQNLNIKRTKEQAKSRADSIVNILKKQPDKFREFALKFSDYPSVKDDGGDLKDLIDGNPNVSIFFNEGLKMKPNEVKVMETGIGYAVFKLNDKTKPVKKVKMAILQRAIEPSNQTYQDTYLKASAFSGKNKTPEAFAKSAGQQGLAVHPAQNVKAMDNNLMGMPGAREVVRWAFSKNAKTGDISSVFDLSGKYAVAELKAITPKGYIPLAQIKDRIQGGVRNDKKIEMMKDRLAQAMKSVKDLNALASQFNIKVDTSSITFSGYSPSRISRESEVVGTLFTMKKGQLVGPLKGKTAAFVVNIDDIITPAIPVDLRPLKDQLQNNFSNQVMGSLYEAIKKNSKIKDNRINFY